MRKATKTIGVNIARNIIAKKQNKITHTHTHFNNNETTHLLSQFKHEKLNVCKRAYVFSWGGWDTENDELLKRICSG